MLRMLRKIISLTVILSFIFSNFTLLPELLAKPAEPVKEKPAVSKSKAQPKKLPSAKDISIPADLGKISKVYSASPNAPLIIHIQDLHTNYEAQKKLSKTLEHLAKNYGVVLILVEGGSRSDSLSFLRTYAPKDVRIKVAEKYLKEGKICGENYLDIISDDLPMDVFGIEKPELYDANMEAFLEIEKFNQRALNEVTSLKMEADFLKEKIYSKPLKEFDQKHRDFKDEKLDAVSYITYLNSKFPSSAGSELSKNLAIFNQLAELEKQIDFNKVENEHQAVIEKLSGKLTKNDLQNLTKQALKVKEGKIAAKDYYVYLKQIAQNNGINLTAKKEPAVKNIAQRLSQAINPASKAQSYQNLTNYIAYLELVSSLDQDQLFKEIKQLERFLQDDLAKTEPQKELANISYNLELLGNLLQLKITPDDYDYFTAHKSELKTVNFVPFLRKNGANVSAAKTLDANFDKLASFYSAARQRDQAFVDNSIKAINNRIEEGAPKIAVLIAGGFHTEQITRMFKDKGMSYVVVAPKVTSEMDENFYHRVLRETYVPMSRDNEELRQRNAGENGPTIKNIGDALDYEVDIQLQRYLDAPGQVVELVKEGRDRYTAYEVKKVKAYSNFSFSSKKDVLVIGEKGQKLYEISDPELIKVLDNVTLMGRKRIAYVKGVDRILDGKQALVHTGTRNWFGEYALSRLLVHNPGLLERILQHERKHERPKYTHEKDPEYPQLLKDVEQFVDEVAPQRITMASLTQAPAGGQAAEPLLTPRQEAQARGYVAQIPEVSELSTGLVKLFQGKEIVLSKEVITQLQRQGWKGTIKLVQDLDREGIPEVRSLEVLWGKYADTTLGRLNGNTLEVRGNPIKMGGVPIISSKAKKLAEHFVQYVYLNSRRDVSLNYLIAQIADVDDSTLEKLYYILVYINDKRSDEEIEDIRQKLAAFLNNYQIISLPDGRYKIEREVTEVKIEKRSFLLSPGLRDRIDITLSRMGHETIQARADAVYRILSQPNIPSGRYTPLLHRLNILRTDGSPFNVDALDIGDEEKEILERVQQSTAGISKDFGGKEATNEAVNTAIQAQIKAGNVIKLRFLPGPEGKVQCYKPKFMEKFDGPRIDDVGEIVEVPFDQNELYKLRSYLASALVGNKAGYDINEITIGIIKGQSMVHPAEDETFSIVHAGQNTATFWFGELLLRDILKKIEDADAKFIFHHDVKHLNYPLGALAEHQEENYQNKVRQIKARCQRLWEAYVKAADSSIKSTLQAALDALLQDGEIAQFKPQAEWQGGAPGAQLLIRIFEPTTKDWQGVFTLRVTNKGTPEKPLFELELKLNNGGYNRKTGVINGTKEQSLLPAVTAKPEDIAEFVKSTFIPIIKGTKEFKRWLADIKTQREIETLKTLNEVLKADNLDSFGPWPRIAPTLPKGLEGTILNLIEAMPNHTPAERAEEILNLQTMRKATGKPAEALNSYLVTISRGKQIDLTAVVYPDVAKILSEVQKPAGLAASQETQIREYVAQNYYLPSHKALGLSGDEYSAFIDKIFPNLRFWKGQFEQGYDTAQAENKTDALEKNLVGFLVQVNKGNIERQEAHQIIREVFRSRPFTYTKFIYGVLDWMEKKDVTRFTELYKEAMDFEVAKTKKKAYVMSGGPGLRLPGVSSDDRAKPFIKIEGKIAGRTNPMLIQLTIDRLFRSGFTDIVVQTNIKYKHNVQEMLQGYSEEERRYIEVIYEPVKADTGIAFCLAMLHAAKTMGEDGVAFISPADHIIPEEQWKAFASATDRAVKNSYCNPNLSILGIEPERDNQGGLKPNGELGHVVPMPTASQFQNLMGVAGLAGANPVKQFVEKPGEDKSRELINSGAVFNGGYFAFLGHLIQDLAKELAFSEAQIAKRIELMVKEGLLREDLANKVNKQEFTSKLKRLWDAMDDEGNVPENVLLEVFNENKEGKGGAVSFDFLFAMLMTPDIRFNPRHGLSVISCAEENGTKFFWRDIGNLDDFVDFVRSRLNKPKGDIVIYGGEIDKKQSKCDVSLLGQKGRTVHIFGASRDLIIYDTDKFTIVTQRHESKKDSKDGAREIKPLTDAVMKGFPGYYAGKQREPVYNQNNRVEDGAMLRGDAVAIKSNGATVISEQGLCGVFGLEGWTVVKTKTDLYVIASGAEMPAEVVAIVNRASDQIPLAPATPAVTSLAQKPKKAPVTLSQGQVRTIHRLLRELKDYGISLVYDYEDGQPLVLDYTAHPEAWLMDRFVVSDVNSLIDLMKDRLIVAKKEAKRQSLTEDDEVQKSLFEALFAPVGKKLRVTPGKRIKVVIFRGGRGASAVTRVLKNIDCLDITIIVAGTDDGKSFHQTAKELGITGLPDIGKAYLDLADNEDVVSFIEKRFNKKEGVLDVLLKDKPNWRGLRYQKPNRNFMVQVKTDLDHIKKHKGKAEKPKLSLSPEYLLAKDIIDRLNSPEEEEFREMMQHPRHFDFDDPRDMEFIALISNLLLEKDKYGFGKNGLNRCLTALKNEFEIENIAFRELFERIISGSLSENDKGLEMVAAFQKLLSKQHEKASKIREYLGLFKEELASLLGDKYSKYDFHEIPLRSIILTALTLKHKDRNSAGREFANLLDVSEHHRVVTATQENYHLVGILANGDFMPAEDDLNEIQRPDLPHGDVYFIGLVKDSWWSAEKKAEREELQKKGRTAAEKVKYLRDNNYLIESPNASLIASEALDNADMILYLPTSLESNMGASLIVPGIHNAIAGNKKAIKIFTPNTERESDPVGTKVSNLLERKFGYESGQQARGSTPINWEQISNFVTHIVGLREYPVRTPEKAISLDADELRSKGIKGINVVAMDIGGYKKEDYSRYLPWPLVSAIISIKGIEDAGYTIKDGKLEKKPNNEFVTSETTVQQLADIILKENNPARAAEAFKLQYLPQQMPDRLVTINNILLNNKCPAKLLKQFCQELMSWAQNMDSQYAEQARSLNLIIGQTLNIVSWIERDISPIKNIRLTNDPEQMVKSPDKERGPSFLDIRTIPIPQATGETIPGATSGLTPGIYWRGTEPVTKMGSNISDRPKFGMAKFESSKDNLWLYVMNHGFVDVPKAIMGMTEGGAISTIHETALTTDLLPGSVQYASTGPGHFQGTTLDIKYVTEGTGIQWNKIYDENGNLVKVIAQELKPGTWTVALPGVVDSMENLGGLRFNDFSLTVTDAQADSLLKSIDPNLNFAQINAAKGTITEAAAKAPYYAVSINNQPRLVGTEKANVDVSWVSGIPAQGESAIDIYNSLTKPRITNLINSILQTVSSGTWQIQETSPITTITALELDHHIEVMKLAQAGEPIIYTPGTNLSSQETEQERGYVFQRDDWAGAGIARLLKLKKLVDGALEKIAGVWFNSTHKKGSSKVPGTDIALSEVIEANPEGMLGPGMTSKPIFSKFLGKDENQPQIVHLGFNGKAIFAKKDKNGKQRFTDMESDFKPYFVSLCVKERTLVMELKDKLVALKLTPEQFEAYDAAYKNWVSDQTSKRWAPNNLPQLPDFMNEFDTTIFQEISKVRQEIVSYLNEITLEPGQCILAPVGYIHSIVGSHQGHPLTGPEAKNEAWYIFSIGKDKNGKDRLLYFEPQQMADTTYSPFDFPTGISWDKEKQQPGMRKSTDTDKEGKIKGLDVSLLPGKPAPQTDEEAIRIIAERAFDYVPSKPENFLTAGSIKKKDDTIVSATPRGVENGLYEGALNTQVEVLIQGAYPPVWKQDLFTLHKIKLEGKSASETASITINPLQTFHELVVIKGEVEINIKGRREMLVPGSSVFIPASLRESYMISSKGEAEVLRLYPPQKQEAEIAPTPIEPVTQFEESLTSVATEVTSGFSPAELKEQRGIEFVKSSSALSLSQFAQGQAGEERKVIIVPAELLLNEQVVGLGEALNMLSQRRLTVEGTPKGRPEFIVYVISRNAWDRALIDKMDLPPEVKEMLMIRTDSTFPDVAVPSEVIRHLLSAPDGIAGVKDLHNIAIVSKPVDKPQVKEDKGAMELVFEGATIFEPIKADPSQNEVISAFNIFNTLVRGFAKGGVGAVIAVAPLRLPGEIYNEINDHLANLAELLKAA